MPPVFASSRPILIGSAAAALAMNGLPSGLAAPNVAAPNNAWRRVTNPAGFLTSMYGLPLSAALGAGRSLRDTSYRARPTERDGRLRHHPPTCAKPAYSPGTAGCSVGGTQASRPWLVQIAVVHKETGPGYSISGRNCARRLMILPETMNTPSPV